MAASRTTTSSKRSSSAPKGAAAKNGAGSKSAAKARGAGSAKPVAGAAPGKFSVGRGNERIRAAKRASDKLKPAELLEMYRTMRLARRFEEWVITLFRDGELPGFLHVAIGQEAIAAGVGHALHDDDYIGSTHRAHAHIIARGSSPAAMMAEMMGKITGLCQGKGGSMHLSDMSRNVVGANGVVGAGGPMMAGVALAQQHLGTGRIAAAFYGDGASNQGAMHESMNLAQLWKLPVLFICENNGFAESTPYWQQVPVKDLAVRGAAFDMKTYSVDGNDPLEVYDATVEAAEYARTGKGPVYIVAETTRISGHYVGDAEVYRPKEDVKAAKSADPIPRFREVLLARKVKSADIDEIDADVDRIMEEAVDTARSAQLPPAEDALKHVYVEYPYPGPVLGV